NAVIAMDYIAEAFYHQRTLLGLFTKAHLESSNGTCDEKLLYNLLTVRYRGVIRGKILTYYDIIVRSYERIDNAKVLRILEEAKVTT
ncbi:MAG: hypothetical protein SVV67_11175, partial [Bacillota bacterium]|nr:hypothetical protein [Bacillota bacterium]